MKILLNALREVYGLFVEDGSYATAIVIWIVVAALIIPRVAGAAAWSGPLLFIGLALILVENVLRTVRNK